LPVRYWQNDYYMCSLSLTTIEWTTNFPMN
jgi:hypothetical protein